MQYHVMYSLMHTTMSYYEIMIYDKHDGVRPSLYYSYTRIPISYDILSTYMTSQDHAIKLVTIKLYDINMYIYI